MERDTRMELGRQLERLERRLPDFAARLMAWSRQPGGALVRVPAGVLLILAGVAGAVLPVLGMWMIPLGLALMALDIPSLRPPLIRMLAWINRRANA
jgi:hypothetical protein